MPTLPLTASAVVVNGVTTWISNGQLGSGHLLPSERILAKEFSVSRKAVRRAISLLTENGVVRNHPSGARTITIGRSPADEAPARPTARTFVQRSMAIVAADVAVAGDRRGFNIAVAGGVSDAVRDAGYHAITIHPNHLDHGVSDQNVAELLDSRPAGMLVPDVTGQGPLHRQVLQQCAELGIPTVIYGGAPELSGFDRVTSDHAAGTYELTKWLISQGRKRILQLAPGTSAYWFPGRRAGFERAILEAKLELLPTKEYPDVKTTTAIPMEDPAYLQTVIPYVAGHLAVDLLGPRPIDAIVCVSDDPAQQVIGACELLGKKTHQDVMVVGYDNYWRDRSEYRRAVHPVAATVDKNNHEIGVQMVKLMIDRIAGRLPATPTTRMVTPSLIISSTDEMRQFSHL